MCIRDRPEGIAGCVVAVADKLDTIAGMFAIGEPPTGSKDPFALRRSAIGVLNILRDRLGCGYEAIVEAALDGYLERGLAFDKDEVEASVCAFIKGRMEQMAVSYTHLMFDIAHTMSIAKTRDVRCVKARFHPCIPANLR